MSFNSPPSAHKPTILFMSKQTARIKSAFREHVPTDTHTCMSHILIDALPTTRPQQHPSTSLSAHTNIHTLHPEGSLLVRKAGRGHGVNKLHYPYHWIINSFPRQPCLQASTGGPSLLPAWIESGFTQKKHCARYGC